MKTRKTITFLLLALILLPVWNSTPRTGAWR